MFQADLYSVLKSVPLEVGGCILPLINEIVIGGMGLVLTTPPMAAMFFQGTLGSFMAYSQIGGSAVATTPGPSGQPPGSYVPGAPAANNGRPNIDIRQGGGVGGE
jgi:hypothetical protein